MRYGGLQKAEEQFWSLVFLHNLSGFVICKKRPDLILSFLCGDFAFTSFYFIFYFIFVFIFILFFILFHFIPFHFIKLRSLAVDDENINHAIEYLCTSWFVYLARWWGFFFFSFSFFFLNVTLVPYMCFVCYTSQWKWRLWIINN